MIFVKRLRRKVDRVLLDWKKRSDRLPLVIKGARQIGKTEAIEEFARSQYAHVVEINFALQQEYRAIFDDGFAVDRIIQNITLLHPELTVKPHETLIFFDEMQACPNCATSAQCQGSCQ